MKTSHALPPKKRTSGKQPRKVGISAPAQRALAEILAAEIAGTPINAQEYRAHSSRRIELLNDLERRHIVDRDGLTYVITFWGLLNLRTRQAQAVLRHCKTVFEILLKHYRNAPSAVLQYSVLEERSHLTAEQTMQAIRLLNRSSASVGTCTDPKNAGVMPSERHLTLRTFDNLKKETRQTNNRPTNYFPTNYSILNADALAIVSTYLESCESQEVRDSWQKAMKRASSDFDGAITSARTLIESVCRYILEDVDVSLASNVEFGQLYKAAAKELGLDSGSHSHPALRQILGNCSGVVSGLAELRNALSDAHGKGTRRLKPARRHAELAVLLAGATSSFLLATLDAKRRP